ncbi:MAG: imidazolonepropionase [Crocinitomicaceae bacterium]|nr:imidazolonepropionase [Crocinitomicaceae bacterium]
MKILKNIKALYLVEEQNPSFKKGEAMNQINTIEHAFLVIEGERIANFGKMSDLIDQNWTEVIDCTDQYVLPTFVDSHSHIVYAGTREGEFIDKINGLSYEEIAAKGGGILNSAEKLRKATENELFEQSMVRAQEVITTGTGALEIKSGYGLSVESEMKMLRVIQRIKEESDLSIKATFLGAHAYPKEYKDNKRGYLDLIIKEMIPNIAKEKLADYIDVFCESNYFSVEETIEIMDAGKNHGLIPKIHVNQFTSIGGIQACVQHGALSVDHLEILTDEDIEALKTGNTIPTILPACSLFIEIPYGPGKKLIENGLGFALATDYNPGSSPCGNMQLVMSLACIKMKISPNAALNASTINGAYAMNLEHELGSITKGKLANLIITNKIPSVGFIPYSFGTNDVAKVILKGKIQ